jgi:hypothetical protein
MEQNMSMADTLLSAVDDKSEVGKLLSSLLANPFQLQALRLVLGMQVRMMWGVQDCERKVHAEGVQD